MLYLRYGKTAKQMNMHIIPCLHTSCRICKYVYTTNHQINLEKQINGYQRCITFDPDASRLDTCRVKVPPGARVRPRTNYWVSYQPTNYWVYHPNQLLGILPTNYWVYLTNQLLGILPTNLQHSFYQFSPPWQPMLLMIQVQVQHSFYQCSPPWQPMFSFRV